MPQGVQPQRKVRIQPRKASHVRFDRPAGSASRALFSAMFPCSIPGICPCISTRTHAKHSLSCVCSDQLLLLSPASLWPHHSLGHPTQKPWVICDGCVNSPSVAPWSPRQDFPHCCCPNSGPHHLSLGRLGSQLGFTCFSCAP